jgi:quercetin dioxygenase-like cupin family protein
MATSTPSGSARPQHPDQGIAAPFISCEVPLEIARLRAERGYAVEGHAGRTLAKYPDLRVVLETMKPGARLSLHETAERMTLQVLVGRLRVHDRNGERHDVGEGSFAAVDLAQVHELESVDECAFLLTLAWPPARSPGMESGGAGI